MKFIKDKSFYKVTKEEINSVKGVSNIKKAFKLITLNKKVLLCLVLLFIVHTAISLASALITRQVLTLFTESIFTEFTKYAFILLGINFLYYVVMHLYDNLFDRFIADMKYKLRTTVFSRIISLKASCFAANNTSTFSHRLRDAGTLANTFVDIFNMVYQLITSLTYCVVLVIYTPIFFVVCASFYLVKILANKYLIPRYNALSRRTHKYEDKVANIAIETIRGASDIKSLNMSEGLSSEYQTGYDEVFSRYYSLGVFRRRINTPINFVSYALNSFVFLILVANLAVTKSFESGSLLFFWTYKGNIATFFRIIFDMRNKFATIEVAASRMMELYDEEQYPVEVFGDKTIENMKGDIKFKNVSFHYEKGKPVLTKVSFDIEANKITAIVGKTGCGKSTTLSLIAKFYDPTKGSITLDGIKINELSKETLRNNIGYVQQSPYIFNRTFRENLLLVKPDATDKEIIAACKKSEIHDFILSTKDKYDTLLGENGITLSGGQKQRLAIARAILNNSKVIMFDESTSSLDNENQAKIQSVIENLSKDHTIVVVAHRLSTIINADKIIFMDNSKIVAEGTHKELFENCEQYRNLYQIENI